MLLSLVIYYYKQLVKLCSCDSGVSKKTTNVS